MLPLNKRSKPRQYLSLALVATLALYACSDERHLRDLKQYVAGLEQHKPAPSNAISNGMPKSVQYHATTTRSPFDLAATTVDYAGLNPLEAYPLSALELKGIGQDKASVWAYIQAPDNKLYQVKKGDTLGDHHGLVLDILPSSITVEEPLMTEGKQGAKRVVTLQLKDENP